MAIPSRARFDYNALCVDEMKAANMFADDMEDVAKKGIPAAKAIAIAEEGTGTYETGAYAASFYTGPLRQGAFLGNSDYKARWIEFGTQHEVAHHVLKRALQIAIQSFGQGRTDW